MAPERRRWIAKGVVVAVLVTCGVVIAAILGLFLGSGNRNPIGARFMLKPDDIIVERRPDPAYDQLFPYYVELCAISQWTAKTSGQGGVTGHAVMHLKGACKDYIQAQRAEVDLMLERLAELEGLSPEGGSNDGRP